MGKKIAKNEPTDESGLDSSATNPGGDGEPMDTEMGENDEKPHPLYHMLGSSPFASPRADSGSNGGGMGDDSGKAGSSSQRDTSSSTRRDASEEQGGEGGNGEFGVKIADLGNACWTVGLIFIINYEFL